MTPNARYGEWEVGLALIGMNGTGDEGRRGYDRFCAARRLDQLPQYTRALQKRLAHQDALTEDRTPEKGHGDCNRCQSGLGDSSNGQLVLP
jgi:hypothetical protein